jgi:predicted tellurium resistance membrane protein TerC
MGKEEPISITSAQESLTKDQSGRARRYFISMMIRTACFILTVILPSPYRWIALSGALLLPYIAVIVANAGRETIQKKTVYFDSEQKAISDRKSN